MSKVRDKNKVTVISSQPEQNCQIPVFTDLGVELLLSASVAVSTAVLVFAHGGVPPLIVRLH